MDNDLGHTHKSSTSTDSTHRDLDQKSGKSPNLDNSQKISVAGNASLQKNSQGLPEKLQHSLEKMSGFSMEKVKVHRNSSKPAQLKAHAVAMGMDIHLAPGKEEHLPHEAWHVIQQMQGRVKPTKKDEKNQSINDSEQLENEAESMGNKANHQAQ